MYFPKVEHPNMSNNIPQMKSECFQKPFYFGGSQVPVNLGLPKQSYSGSGFVGDAPPKYTNGKYHILKQGLGVGQSSRRRRRRIVVSNGTENSTTDRSNPVRSIAERVMYDNEMEQVIINDGIIENPLSILNNNQEIYSLIYDAPNNIKEIYDRMEENLATSIENYNILKRYVRRRGLILPDYR